MDRILLNDFPSQWAQVGSAALAAVDRVGRSGWLILGSEVAAFEEALAERWGLPQCVGCACGLDALEISLRCLGLKPGEKVLTTPLSAFATTLAIMRAGGVPVFVDVDVSGQLDLSLARKALEAEKDIRFAIPVHLYGHALDLPLLESLRQEFELCIVEDCAQAIGARSHGRGVGSVGQAAATSFYPTKNLGCMGDGGAILSASAELAERARSLRDYGQSEKYVHTQIGSNSRLDEIQAAILRDALLPRLGEYTRRRREIAERYRAEIQHPALSIPPVPEGSESVWHLFPLLVSGDPQRFQDHLGGAGIASARHYPTLIPDQRALRDYAEPRSLGALTNAQRFARGEVSLPIHPHLTDPQVEKVIETCNDWPE